jgi:uncharacterized protein
VAYGSTVGAVGPKPAWREPVKRPEDLGMSATRVRYRSRNGQTYAALRIPAKGDPQALVLLAHGSHANSSNMLERAAFLSNAGYDVLALDLRAHGESEGNFMTPGYLEGEDVVDAIAMARASTPGAKIVLLGHSYGGVAVLHAAAKSADISAVIADAAFKTYQDMMNRGLDMAIADPASGRWTRLGLRMFKRLPLGEPVSRLGFLARTGVWVTPKRANALPLVGRIAAPVLFLTGEADPITLPADGEAMLRESTNPLSRHVVLAGADHATYTKARDQYERVVLSFLAEVMPVSRRSA